MASQYINVIALGLDKNIIWRLDYDVRTDGQPLYFGYAVSGTTETVDDWLIYKFTYNGGSPDSLTQRDVAYGAWSERANLTYK